MTANKLALDILPQNFPRTIRLSTRRSKSVAMPAYREPHILQTRPIRPTPPNSWIDDPIEGGGRIVGEICHFIDLIQHFTSALPVRVFAERMGNSVVDDSVVATLHMSNGDIASITYVAGGDKRYPRERVEVFGSNSVGVIENFRTADFITDGRKRSFGGRKSTNRGHQEQLQILARCILSQSPSPVSMEEYVATTLATFALERSIRSRKSEPVAYIARTE